MLKVGYSNFLKNALKQKVEDLYTESTKEKRESTIKGIPLNTFEKLIRQKKVLGDLHLGWYLFYRLMKS